MLGHRMRMFGIGTIAALAVGLWQVDTAKADHHGRRSYGRTYYSTSYYSGGCRPVYVAPVVYYPARTYYYSSSSYCAPSVCESSYCAPSRSVGFSFSYSSSRGHYRDYDRDIRVVRSRHRSYSHYGRHHGR